MTYYYTNYGKYNITIYELACYRNSKLLFIKKTCNFFTLVGLIRQTEGQMTITARRSANDQGSVITSYQSFCLKFGNVDTMSNPIVDLNINDDDYDQTFVNFVRYVEHKEWYRKPEERRPMPGRRCKELVQFKGYTS